MTPFQQYDSDVFVEDSYECPACKKMYRAKSSLSLHRRFECGKEPKFKCPCCPKRCHQKGNLKIHILTKHKDHTKLNDYVISGILQIFHQMSDLFINSVPGYYTSLSISGQRHCLKYITSAYNSNFLLSCLVAVFLCLLVYAKHHRCRGVNRSSIL